MREEMHGPNPTAPLPPLRMARSCVCMLHTLKHHAAVKVLSGGIASRGSLRQLLLPRLKPFLTL